MGYILSRVRFKLNRLLYTMFLMGMLIPIHSLLVPIYVVFRNAGLSDKWYTLFLPYISFGLPMGIFLVEGYVKGIPISLEEAAAIDGSGFSYTLWRIILPLCRPILITIAIIQVFSCWNEFSFALVLINDPRLQTVPLALTQFKGQFASDYPKQMAAMLITMSPISTSSSASRSSKAWLRAPSKADFLPHFPLSVWRAVFFSNTACSIDRALMV